MAKEIKEVIILHDINGKTYFGAIENSDIKVKYYETVVFKRLFSNIIKGNIKKSSFKKFFKNLSFRFKVLFLKDKNIIIGTGPLDCRFIYYSLLKRKNNVIYQTSWPYWGLKYPKNYLFFNKVLSFLWRKILKSKYLKLSSVSIAAKESMEEFLNKDKKVSVITHSVDRSYFYKKKNKNNKLKILYVGRIVKEKGIDIIKKLILLDKNKNFDFTLVGNGKDEYILEDIIERENVHYLGKIKDKNILGDIYRKSDVLIVPSKKTKTWEELFGIVIIEAIISGVIPIATDHVGPKEIINNKNGFIIKESKNMHIEIYNILNKLMNNRVLMENIKNNLENESKKYDSKKILEKWLSLLLEE